MAQGHMDRLSALDVSFLTNESSASHMHVGGICIFEGPPPSYEDLLEHVRSRLHLVPRFRQKLAYPPLPTGRPFWRACEITAWIWPSMWFTAMSGRPLANESAFA